MPLKRKTRSKSSNEYYEMDKSLKNKYIHGLPDTKKFKARLITTSSDVSLEKLPKKYTHFLDDYDVNESTRTKFTKKLAKVASHKPNMNLDDVLLEAIEGVPGLQKQLNQQNKERHKTYKTTHHPSLSPGVKFRKIDFTAKKLPRNVTHYLDDYDVSGSMKAKFKSKLAEAKKSNNDKLSKYNVNKATLANIYDDILLKAVDGVPGLKDKIDKQNKQKQKSHYKTLQTARRKTLKATQKAEKAALKKDEKATLRAEKAALKKDEQEARKIERALIKETAAAEKAAKKTQKKKTSSEIIGDSVLTPDDSRAYSDFLKLSENRGKDVDKREFYLDWYHNKLTPRQRKKFNTHFIQKNETRKATAAANRAPKETRAPRTTTARAPRRRTARVPGENGCPAGQEPCKKCCKMCPENYSRDEYSGKCVWTGPAGEEPPKIPRQPRGARVDTNYYRGMCEQKDMDYNPKYRRCMKKCGDNKTRNGNGRCEKDKGHNDKKIKQTKHKRQEERMNKLTRRFKRNKTNKNKNKNKNKKNKTNKRNKRNALWKAIDDEESVWGKNKPLETFWRSLASGKKVVLIKKGNSGKQTKHEIITLPTGPKTQQKLLDDYANDPNIIAILSSNLSQDAYELHLYPKAKDKSVKYVIQHYKQYFLTNIGNKTLVP